MTYRDDHDAALARIAALEHELREARREIAMQRDQRPAADIRLPVIARQPHAYEDSWTSTSAEADRQLQEALRDAKAYRREQDANGARDVIERRVKKRAPELRVSAPATASADRSTLAGTAFVTTVIAVLFTLVMIASTK